MFFIPSETSCSSQITGRACRKKKVGKPYILLTKFMQRIYVKIILRYEFPTSSIHLTCYICYWGLICTSVHELQGNKI